MSWLLDICPPEYRSYPVLRRHVVVLARFALLHVEASQAAVRKGLSEARAVLRDVAEPGTVETAVETWHAEAARLAAERRAVGLVEEALRGRRDQAIVATKVWHQDDDEAVTVGHAASIVAPLFVTIEEREPVMFDRFESVEQMFAYVNDVEARQVLGALASSCVVLGLYLFFTGTYDSLGESLRHATFNLVTIATDCGYATQDFGAWPAFAPWRRNTSSAL